MANTTTPLDFGGPPEDLARDKRISTLDDYRIIPNTHDNSRSGEHIASIQKFMADLESAATAAWLIRDNTVQSPESPQVILAIPIQSTEVDITIIREFLRLLPPECKDIKIEGVYRGFSTLPLLRMPVPIWKLLPANPAYSFVGFVKSPNLSNTATELHADAAPASVDSASSQPAMTPQRAASLSTGDSHVELNRQERMYRVPDSEGYRISSVLSRNGRVEVINHNAQAHRNEPRASEATHEDYNKASEHRSGRI